MPTTSIFPVILSGGSGTRLWPLSRAALPKQFLPLVSDKTMFQETLLRLQNLPGVTISAGCLQQRTPFPRRRTVT